MNIIVLTREDLKLLRNSTDLFMRILSYTSICTEITFVQVPGSTPLF